MTLNPRTLILVAALAAPLAVTPGAAQSGGMSGMPGMSGGASMDSMTTLENLSGRAFDVAYMSQMIVHHQGATEMASMEVKNGKRANVKASAQKIIDDQTKEIKQLEGWLKSWYNTAPDQKRMAMMKADMKPMMDKAMAGMNPSGGKATNVDRTFLQNMIVHHTSAIDMSQIALRKATKPELKQFALGVIEAQAKEIVQFQTWLDAGY